MPIQAANLRVRAATAVTRPPPQWGGMNTMSARVPDAATLDELLRLAGVATANQAARGWLESALVAACNVYERLAVAGGTRVPRPSPAEHNAPLSKIERSADRLIAELKRLRRHPHAHASFWRSPTLGPAHAGSSPGRPSTLPASASGSPSKQARPSPTSGGACWHIF